MNRQDFIDQYIATALWSTNDESTPQGGEPFDANYGPEDLSPECRKQMEQDCNAFMDANWEDIQEDLSQAGHDFWLTRNGHGAGFWDGDWEKATGERLTKASKTFGEVHLYLGDDNLIHHG